MKAREQALQILLRIEQNGAFTQDLLAAVKDSHDFGFLTELVKGTLQWQSRLDAEIGKVLKGTLSNLPAPVRAILRLGAYQVLFLTKVPREVSVHECVELTKKYGHPGTVKLVNAVLRKISADRLTAIELVPTTATEIALHFSHPEWIVTRWCEQFGIKETAELCRINNERWPLTFRANSLRTTAAKLIDTLAKEGVHAAKASWHPECLTVTELPQGLRLGELKSFVTGLFQVQDESAAFVATIAAPTSGQIVFDLCAAPGGKSTHCAALMGNQGTVIAADLSRRRLTKVEESAARLGISTLAYLVMDGLSPALRQTADVIILDAPCSGTGVLGKKSDLRWNKQDQDINRLSELQCSLIHAASTLLKPGGRLVYSTCSIEAEENSKVVDRFLETHSDFRRLPIEGVPAELITAAGDMLTLPHKHKIAGAYAALLGKR